MEGGWTEPWLDWRMCCVQDAGSVAPLLPCGVGADLGERKCSFQNILGSDTVSQFRAKEPVVCSGERVISSVSGVRKTREPHAKTGSLFHTIHRDQLEMY